MKIWYDGDLQCDRCNKCGFILDWEFECGNHGKKSYLGPQSHKLISALASLFEISMPMKDIFNILDKIRERSEI